MVLDLLIYYGIVFFPTTMLYRTRNTSKRKSSYKLAVIFACLIPTFFFAIRYNVGTDWTAYKGYYESITLGLARRFKVLEPGYYYLMVLCKALGMSFYGFNFVCCAILELALLKSFDTYNLKTTQWMGYFLSFFSIYFVAYNITRQMMATSFVILFYAYYKNGKIIRAFVWLALAVAFHKTAILGIAILLICQMFKWLALLGKEKTFIGSLLIAGASLVVVPPVISNLQALGIYQFEEYAAHAFDVGELRFLAYYIPEWILLFMFMRRNSDTRVFECYSIVLLGCIFQFLACVYPFIDRLSWYFVGFRILLYPMILSTLEPRPRRQFCILTVAWFLLYFFVMFYLLPGDNMFPYTTVLG